jgi:hypothetical protein
MTNRRFPPLLSVEDNGTCFIVKDKNGRRSCETHLGPSLAIANFRQMQGKFSRVL